MPNQFIAASEAVEILLQAGKTIAENQKKLAAKGMIETEIGNPVSGGGTPFTGPKLTGNQPVSQPSRESPLRVPARPE